MTIWDSTRYYYEMQDGTFIKSDLFYTYDYGIRIYKEELGHIICIMEDKWVLDPPKYISKEEWTLILLRSNGVRSPPVS